MRTCALLLFGTALGCRPDASASAPASTGAEPSSPSPAAAATPSPEPTPDVADASIEASNTAVIECVLAEPRVAKYVHPELAERLPVKLHLASTITIAGVPVAHGAPVVLVDAASALVDVHAIVHDGSSATVQLTIDREGVAATVQCVRADDGWTAGKVELVER